MRCFGRNHCEDGCLALVLSSATAVFCLPVLLFQFVSACLARRGLRGSRGDVCLQLCSCSAGRWCRRGAGSAAKDLENFETSLRRQCLMASGEEQYAATKLRFVCLSDTHMRHASIRVPDGDVLVHTGDFTNHGTLKQTLEFADWFASQPHKVKICVPGNHDMIMDKDYWREFWSDWTGPSSRGSHSEAMDAFKDRFKVGLI